MLDRVVKALVALGVPALVLMVVISTSGVAGGAAIVVALATLGGPLGMMGGFATLGLLLLVSYGIAKIGIDALFGRVVKGLIKKGMTREQIVTKVFSYPISKGLKLKIKEILDKHFG